MTGIAPISRSELSQRRKQLRHQRRAKRLQSVAQLMLAGGIAAAAVWVVRQPIWVIQTANQVKITGNQFLSAQTIRDLVPINYPQSIFRTQPQAIVDTLKAKAPLSAVAVQRQLFPPELTISVREQTPVATIYSKTLPGGKPSPEPDALIDAQGNVIPLQTYHALEQSVQLPSLKILGGADLYRSHWVQAYALVKDSPVAIKQLDWRNMSNLILLTDFGPVHCGPYGDNFRRQLRALDALRKLPEKLSGQTIDHIDLRDPNKPALQRKAIAKPIESAPAAISDYP
jgi:cell division protein FtsQ